MTMTPVQIELARHALGLPNKTMRSYRNRYFCAPGGMIGVAWGEMVQAGFAAVDTNSGGQNACFSLTPEGARLALIPFERLCPEDFPAQEDEESDRG
ncbi:hypothetical protein ACJ4V0_16035 [Phreatobacter sp. HK31-P]